MVGTIDMSIGLRSAVDSVKNNMVVLCINSSDCRMCVLQVIGFLSRFEENCKKIVKHTNHEYMVCNNSAVVSLN